MNPGQGVRAFWQLSFSLILSTGDLVNYRAQVPFLCVPLGCGEKQIKLAKSEAFWKH